MAWDYPSTNPPANFILLWGTNAQSAGTNHAAQTPLLPPGSYVFRAAATNTDGSATSAPVMVRVVRVNLEKASSLDGPWTTEDAIYKVWTFGPSNQFFRARLDTQ